MSDSVPVGYLDHVAFCVSDFEAQVAWYKRAFGLHEGEGERIYTDEPYTRSALLMSADNGLCIEIFERPGSTRPRSSGEGPLEGTKDQGFHHWTLRVRDLDATLDHLERAGAKVLGFRGDYPKVGARIAFVADPEGNRLELVQPIPVVGAEPRPGTLARMRHDQATAGRDFKQVETGEAR
jgi:catechol 2,3-dioxygenase-like lactoylglutathione lyase family enzyme